MPKIIQRVSLVVASAICLFALLLGVTPPATATTSTGHGIGYLWTDGVSWIGSYQMADGTRAFCLQAGKGTPIGSDFTYQEGSALGWFNVDDSARVAYISRQWASSSDPTTAAAGQLATWTIAGLNGHTQGWYASRAGSHANEILALTAQMLAEADQNATRGVTAGVTISVPESGTSSVRADLTIDRISTGQTLLASGTHEGTISLNGATFDDGSTSRSIKNGVDVPITPSGADPTVTVDVSTRFTTLPYGGDYTVATNPGPVQNLLVSRPATAIAQSSSSLTSISPRPFQPIVETVTSNASGEPGMHVTDLLTVSVDDSDGLLPVWGVYKSGDELRPIPVTVESSLLGPFPTPIVPAPSAPETAPTVCTVTVPVSGPGQYRTPDCVIPRAGEYVWVERIVPENTPDDQGAPRVKPWSSTFGVASESIRVIRPVPATLAATGSGNAPAGVWAAGSVATIIGTGLAFAGRRRHRRLHADVRVH